MTNTEADLDGPMCNKTNIQQQREMDEISMSVQQENEMDEIPMFPCPSRHQQPLDESEPLAPSPCGSPRTHRKIQAFSQKDLLQAFERHRVLELFKSAGSL